MPGPTSAQYAYSVATYNLLADCYATPGYFKRTDPKILTWRKRKQAVLAVLDALDADILCLQEVDHFESFLLPEMRARGYDGRFKKRNGPSKRDGCATFWRRQRLELVQEHPLELDRATDAALSGPGHQTHNIALMTVLKPADCAGGSGFETGGQGAGAGVDAGKEEGKHADLLCVGNAHLFWDPAYPGIKLLQARAVTSVVQRYYLLEP